MKLGVFFPDGFLNRSNEPGRSFQSILSLGTGSERIGFVKEEVSLTPHPFEPFHQVDIILTQKIVREIHDRPMLSSIGRKISPGEEEGSSGP